MNAAARPIAGAIRTIVTPEGLGLPLTLAGRGARLGALALDMTIQALTMIAAIVALHYLGGDLARSGGQGAGRGGYPGALQFLEILFLIFGFLLHNGWFMAFEMGPRGATPGKRAMGIRVAARGGGALTPEMVIARNLLRDIEVFLPLGFMAQAAFSGGGPGVLAAAGWFALFAFFPFFNRDRLRAGDLIAGTWVVERPRKPLARAMTEQPAHAPAAAYRFRDADLAAYGEYELQRLEEVLRLRKDDQMALVATAICDKIGWNTPHGADVGPFLDAYYTQLRERLEGGMRMGRRKADKHA